MRAWTRWLWWMTLLFLVFPMSVTAVAAQTNVYVVQPGDRLGDIARRLGLDVTCLARTNGILNANRIIVGQTLNLSSCSGQSAAPIIPSTYTVQRSDTLFEIARRFGVDMNCLVRVNAITNPARIQPGQALQIDPCIEQGGVIAPLPVSQNYIVQPGDTMNHIASTFGVQAACLARVNLIANADYLRAGETLIIDFSRCSRQAQG